LEDNERLILSRDIEMKETTHAKTGAKIENKLGGVATVCFQFCCIYVIVVAKQRIFTIPYARTCICSFFIHMSVESVSTGFQIQIIERMGCRWQSTKPHAGVVMEARIYVQKYYRHIAVGESILNTYSQQNRANLGHVTVQGVSWQPDLCTSCSVNITVVGF
jgi:hypothetical protein